MIVVWNIVKVIAGILLVLLLLFLLLLFLLLFVPFRYRLEGQYGAEVVSFRGRVTYLLHSVSLQIHYQDTLRIKLKLFGIPVFDSGRKKREKKKKKSEASRAPEKKESKKEESRKGEPPKQEEKPAAWEPLETSENKPRQDGEKIPQRKTKKIPYPSSEEKTVEKILEKLKSLLELWKKEETQITFALGKETIKKVLKAFLPRKWQFRGHVGFEDPSLTGYFMAVLGMLYLFWGNHIVIVPNFEEAVLEVEGKAKGRVTVAVALRQFLRIVLNKHCRKFFRLVIDTIFGEKQEERNG